MQTLTISRISGQAGEATGTFKISNPQTGKTGVAHSVALTAPDGSHLGYGLTTDESRRQKALKPTTGDVLYWLSEPGTEEEIGGFEYYVNDGRGWEQINA